MRDLLSGFWAWLKEQPKFIVLTLLGFAPLIVFMDEAMGIRLSRDYGGWVMLGFISCVVFYAVIYARYIHDR